VQSGFGPSVLISRGGDEATLADFGDVAFGVAFGVGFCVDLAGGSPFDVGFFFGLSESSPNKKSEELELEEIARPEPGASADPEFFFGILLM
jgi:hypothetical protein